MDKEFSGRVGDPAAIAMDLTKGFARLVEALARTQALEPVAGWLDHTLINLQNHAQELGHTDAYAALVAARGAVRNPPHYPDAPKL